MNKTRSWFFEKFNRINNPLYRLTRGHRDSTQINKIKEEKGEITTETCESPWAWSRQTPPRFPEDSPRDLRTSGEWNKTSARRQVLTPDIGQHPN